METQKLIEIGATTIDWMAVVVIVGTFLWASIRFLVHIGRHASDEYRGYKFFLGKSLTLGLDFLVAADVIRTVTLSPTLLNVGILGAGILIRTFLGWSLVVEMEGRWPWQPMLAPRAEATL
jgi:uncharacterized membrane protein